MIKLFGKMFRCLEIRKKTFLKTQTFIRQSERNVKGIAVWVENSSF